jgi:RES domain-containing protein
MLEPHPLYNYFTERLSMIPRKSWTGLGFRSVIPRYANPRDVTSGVGAFRGGGRWNTRGIHAVYASLEPGLSVNEAMRVVFSDRGFSVGDIRPRLVVGIRCRLSSVIDLMVNGSLPQWLDLCGLLNEDWPAPVQGDQRLQAPANGYAGGTLDMQAIVAGVLTFDSA